MALEKYLGLLGGQDRGASSTKDLLLPLPDVQGGLPVSI